jgi:hypothetical protein
MSNITDHDLPPPYQEKPNTGLEEEDGYCVKIDNGSIFTGQTATPSPTKHKLTHDQQLKKPCKDPDLQGQFQFIQPVAVRSLAKFFRLSLNIPSCDSVSRNFGYNLWYFQINYALLLALTVLLAMKE